VVKYALAERARVSQRWRALEKPLLVIYLDILNNLAYNNVVIYYTKIALCPDCAFPIKQTLFNNLDIFHCKRCHLSFRIDNRFIYYRPEFTIINKKPENEKLFLPKDFL